MDQASGVAQPSPRWSAGTLTYTTGGLVLLVSLLLLGDFAWQMRERSVAPVLQILLRVHGASDFLVGLLMGTLPAVFTLIVGPVVSYRSDRLRGRYGRRIPFILVSTPFIVLSLVALAYSPAIGDRLNGLLGGHPAWRNPMILGVFAVSWSVFDLTTAVANAVFGGLVNDVVPRVFIGRFFGLFRVVSLLAAILFNVYLIGGAERHGAAIFLGVGALYGVGVTFMGLQVKEGSYPPPPKGAGGGLFQGVQSYFREGFTSRYYLLFFAVSGLTAAIFLPVNSFSLFAADHFGMSMAAYGKCLAASYGVSLVLAYPIGWLTDRYHVMRVAVIPLVVYALTMGWAFFRVDGPGTFAAFFILHTILAGIWNTVIAGFAQIVLPSSHFTQLVSAAAICSTLAATLIAPLLGWFLDQTGHDYRITFGFGAIFAGISLVAWLALSRRFRALGGVPPAP